MIAINFKSFAQGNDCGTKVKGSPIIFTEKEQESINKILAINQPYAIKIYVTVFADDNGTNRASSDANIHRQIQNMANQYQPHNICFILMGIRQINNSDLNNHDADTEEAELSPFMVAGSLNIFIHTALPGLFGIAYNIPNTYLSMRSDAMASTTMNSILAHEMGHCLGLYHTFETWENTKRENVARAGNCKNCTTNGDVLCDTPADDNGGYNSTNCTYTGTGMDACSNASYTPLVNNIMSYFNLCSNAFTSEQRTRMQSFLINNSSLNSFLVHDSIYLPTSANASIYWSIGSQTYVARDFIGVAQFSNNVYDVSGSSNQLIISKRVSLKPGTRLRPSTGRVQITANPYCQ